ncbi:MAG: hypothetical protein PVG03_18460 [Desulfarculaceae bacterium]|jgi:hypothetical protein
MAVEKKVQFEIDHQFDPNSCRHYLNGFCTVLHCHHYATLYTQLADDAKDFNGKALFIQAAEDIFFDVLDKYYQEHGVESINDKLSIAKEYWQIVGMGLIEFKAVGPFAVTAEMDYSHVDEGWLKKWGSRPEPVNFFTCGFVAAVAALTTGRQPRSFEVNEVKSLVAGDDKSVFKAVLH